MKAMTKHTILAIPFACLFAACSTDDFLTYHEDPGNVPNVRQMNITPKTPKDQIVLKQTPNVVRNMMSFHKPLSDKKYAYLGSSSALRWETATPIEDLRKAAYALGADTVFYHTFYDGQQEYTKRIPLYKTKGRTITSTTDTYGSYSGTYNRLGSSNYGNLNGSYQGQSTNTTYIPSKTVYGFQQRQGDVYKTLAYFYVPFSKMDKKVREEFYDKVDQYDRLKGVE